MQVGSDGLFGIETSCHGLRDGIGANTFRSACALDSTVVGPFGKRVGSAVLLKSEYAYVMNACM